MQAHADVPCAVVGRVLKVDKFSARDATKCVRDRTTVISAVAGSHTPLIHLEHLRLIVLHLQVVSHIPELRELHPTSLHAAASRHAVTFACALHCCAHSLWRGREIMNLNFTSNLNGTGEFSMLKVNKY